jgi:hypothetical protein
MFYLVYVISQNAWIKLEAHVVFAIRSFNRLKLSCKKDIQNHFDNLHK